MDREHEMELDAVFSQLSSYESYYTNKYAGLSDTDKQAADGRRVDERAAVMTVLKLDTSIVKVDRVKQAFDKLARAEVDLFTFESEPGYDSDDDIVRINYLSRSIDYHRENVVKAAKETAARLVEATGFTTESDSDDEGPAKKRPRAD